MRDFATGVHGQRLTAWARRIASRLGTDEAYQRDVEQAALLHDIGKIAVPDSILLKPGELDPDERLHIKQHPALGWGILRLIPGFERVGRFVLHHHERMDGRGYPAGLRGKEIPLGARIVCVVDAFDAMTSERPYKQPISPAEAMNRLRQDAGSQFDPEVVETYNCLVGEEGWLHAADVEFDAGAIFPTAMSAA